MGAEGVAISIAPSLSVALMGVIVARAVGVVAGLVPGWQAARAEIVTTLRQA